MNKLTIISWYSEPREKISRGLGDAGDHLGMESGPLPAPAVRMGLLQTRKELQLTSNYLRWNLENLYCNLIGFLSLTKS